MACNKYKQIEDRLYRYANIDETIKELQSEIEDREASQTKSVVEFGVTGGQLPSSVQERFYTRPDIVQRMEKIRQLQEEKERVGKVINSLSPQDKETYRKCFVDNIAGYDVRRVMGIDRRTLNRRKLRLLEKMSQKLT